MTVMAQPKKSLDQRMVIDFEAIPGWYPGCNILDLTIPKQLEQQFSTGIDWFDDSLGGGGITPSTVILLTGSAGAGKTTMLLQLANSITKNEGVCLFNSGEESLYQVRRAVGRLGCQHGFVPGYHTKLNEIISHAETLMDVDQKQLVLIIDSLQCIDDEFYPGGRTNSMTPVRVIQQLASWAKRPYGGEDGIYPIVIVIGQVTKSDVFVGKNQIKHAVDVAAHLTIDEDDKSPTCGFRFFGVSKNRFGCAGREYVLDMQERGLQFKNRVGYVEEDYLEPAAAAANQKNAGGVVASRCLLKTLSLFYVVVWAAAGLLRLRLPSILQLQLQALAQHSLLIRLLSATARGRAAGFPRGAQVQTHVQRSRCNRSFSSN